MKHIIKTDVTGSDYIRYYYDKDGNNTATVTKASGQYVLDTASFDAYGNMTSVTSRQMRAMKTASWRSTPIQVSTR